MLKLNPIRVFKTLWEIWLFMNKEIISVILPVYNGSATLMDTINSVLNQTFKDFKLYICNDHSNDNSEKIVKSFNSKKIYYVKNEKNIGLSKTRKKLLNLAAGNFIAFIDQDDIWIENKLEIQIKNINQLVSYKAKNGINLTYMLTKMENLKQHL